MVSPRATTSFQRLLRPRRGWAGHYGRDGGAREGKRWLAAQGRPGRRFFLAAGLADLASQLGPGGEGLSGGQRRRLGVA
jgi:hypothetical protein